MSFDNMTSARRPSTITHHPSPKSDIPQSDVPQRNNISPKSLSQNLYKPDKPDSDTLDRTPLVQIPETNSLTGHPQSETV
jgi:hypothetical protein